MKKSRFTEEQIIGFLRQAEAGMPIKELRRNHAGIEATFAQLATPMVGAAAGLHRHEAAWGQLGALGQELLALERPVCDHLTCGINRVDLNDVLGQIDADSCNVAHGTSPSSRVETGFRHTNLGTRCRSPEVGSPFVFNQWFFGMKALQGLPAESMVVAC